MAQHDHLAPTSGSQESQPMPSSALRYCASLSPGGVGRGDGANLFNTALGRALKEEFKSDVVKRELSLWL